MNLLSRVNSPPLELTPIEKRGRKQTGRVVSPDSLPIHLKTPAVVSTKLKILQLKYFFNAQVQAYLI